MNLSDAMIEALELAAEQGELERRSGGFWTPPGEPMRGLSAGPVNGSDRYAKTVTVRALRRRELLDGSGHREPAGLTDAGREVLEEDAG